VHIKKAVGWEDSYEFEYIAHENHYKSGDEGGQQDYERPHGECSNHLTADRRNSLFVMQPHAIGDIMMKNTAQLHHLRHHLREKYQITNIDLHHHRKLSHTHNQFMDKRIYWLNQRSRK
jgi:hypothetical protein